MSTETEGEGEVRWRAQQVRRRRREEGPLLGPPSSAFRPASPSLSLPLLLLAGSALRSKFYLLAVPTCHFGVGLGWVLGLLARAVGYGAFPFALDLLAVLLGLSILLVGLGWSILLVGWVGF